MSCVAAYPVVERRAVRLRRRFEEAGLGKGRTGDGGVRRGLWVFELPRHAWKHSWAGLKRWAWRTGSGGRVGIVRVPREPCILLF